MIEAIITVILFFILGTVIGSRYKYSLPWNRQTLESKYLKTRKELIDANAIVNILRDENANLKGGTK